MQQFKDNAGERGPEGKTRCCFAAWESRRPFGRFLESQEWWSRTSFITEPIWALSRWIEVQIVFALFTVPLFGPNQTGRSFTSSCFGYGVNQKKSWHASPLFHNQNDGCTIALRTFCFLRRHLVSIIICLRGFSPYNCLFIVFIYSFMIIMES